MANRETPYALDTEALRRACADVARSIMWDRRPVDMEEVDSVTEALLKIALSMAEYIPEHRDPNLLVRAVVHLGHSHAIPPMRGDTTWFSDMLAAVVELASPTEVNAALIRFLNDIMVGIAEARAEWDQDAERSSD